MVGGVREVEEDILGATDVGVVEQHRGGGSGDSLDGAVLALARAGAHEGGARVFHDGIDILEVDIDAAATGDDFGNTLGSGEKDIVGEAKSFGDIEVAEGTKFIVVDNDNRVDMLAEFLDAGFGLVATLLTLKREGTGNDGHNEDFLVLVVVEVDTLSDFGDDGSSAGAGATAHTGGDEEHLSVMGQGLLDVGSLVGSGLFGALGFVAGTETEVTQWNLVGHRRSVEGFHIGVADDEVDAFDTLTVHVVDCIAATATDAYDLDIGRLSLRGVESEERSLLGGLIYKIGIVLHVLVYFYLTE